MPHLLYNLQSNQLRGEYTFLFAKYVVILLKFVFELFLSFCL